MVVLIDSVVRFEDEIQTIIEESEQPSLDDLMETLINSLPDSISEEDKDEAMVAEYTRYMEEVIEPAYATLLERRRSSRPSSAATTVLKVPPTDAADITYYSELLDVIEPRLSSSPSSGTPSVTTLTLRTSWRPNHPILHYPFSAVVAGSDDVFLVVYFSDGISWPNQMFYLVYDTLENSVSIVPPLPPLGWRCRLGEELAIVAIRKENHPCPCFFVLAELMFRLESRSHLPSNKATLFLWWSPGSRSGGAAATTGRWIQRDVVLPIPADEDGTDYSFRADVIIPVSGRNSVLWVDLLKGILVCDHIDRLVDDGATDTTANDDDAPMFYFIPLPDGCAIQPDFRQGRGQPDKYRSMCNVTGNGNIFKFVSLELESSSGGCQETQTQVMLFRTWLLTLPRDRDTGATWRWEMVMESRVDLWNDPVYKNDLKLQPLMPRLLVISCALGEDDIIYLVLTDFKLERGWTVATASYVIGLDIRHGNIASAIRLDDEVLPLKMFASRVSSLSEEMILWRRSLELTDASIMGKQTVAHEGESGGNFGKWTSCEEEDPLMTYTLGAHRGKFPKWPLCEEHEPPMPYKLGEHFTTFKFCQDGLGGRRIISTLGASPTRTKFKPSASVGLHGALT